MAYSSFDKSNVLFLQGTQANLNALMAGGAKEGAFYLTNDTHRLYIGRNNGTQVVPVAVNEGVVTVADVDSLPSTGINAGEFYYATKENVLCVYNGSQFIQINPDNNTVNDSMAVAIAGAENGATVTHSVTDSATNAVSDAFTIKDSTGNNIITVAGKVIDIKGDKYTLSTEHAVASDKGSLTIKLSSANKSANDSSIVLKAGENVDIAADGTISSSYHNTVNDSLNAVVNSDGTITVTLTDSDSNPLTATTGAIIYKVNGVEVAAGSELPVYSEAEIDAKLRGLNGMTYKGTANALPSADVSAGDTYIVINEDGITVPAANAYDNAQFVANKGDLIIATGEEDANGHIANVKWSHVSSGDDAERDTTYTWTANADAHSLIVTNDTTTDVVGGMKLAAGTALVAESAVAENNVITTTFKHDDINCNEVTEDAAAGLVNFDVVTGIVVNDQGHVTEVKTKNIGAKDTTYAMSAEVAVADNAATISNHLTNEFTTDILTVSHTVISETLALAKGEGNAFSVDIHWGSF